jgi:hypothetical protein
LFGTGVAMPLVFLFIPCSSGAFLPSCKAGAHGFAGDLSLAGIGIELRGEVNRVNAAFEDEEEVVPGIDERSFFADESEAISECCSTVSVFLGSCSRYFLQTDVVSAVGWTFSAGLTSSTDTGG